MVSIDEKRVYGDRDGETTAYVASGQGVAAVSVSDDLVGEYGIDRACTALDVAAADGRLAVATPTDVLVKDGEAYDAVGFGPAVAVGIDGDALVAVGPDWSVARATEPDEWEAVGAVDSPVRAVAGDLIAAENGVYRVRDGEVAHAGLDDARDVSVAGTPLAATGEGLYRLGAGWMSQAGGEFRLAAADRAAAPGDLDRAHAATRDHLYAHADGEWASVDVPVPDPVAGVAYAPGATYAVATDGTFLADAGDGWRTQPLGLTEIGGVAVP
ncbi:HVO_0234 family beta-propeller protein [Halostella litorea]|uniref:HVO_0234 family beta-propeller protein n=1 Tax=Halostella litorea TaxID=2528831 RepID=UPI001092A7A2|nr:hypothetical protein [Halostella litorea]